MRVVTNMLAKPKRMKTSQMSAVKNADKGMEIYLKNSYVCLKSIEIHNPGVECILFVNFKLPKEWIERYSRENIKIQYLEFGGYKISEKYDWDIVQYRYDVINYLCDNLSDEDEVIMLDTDILCVGSLDNVFDEIKYRACFFDVQHSNQVVDRKNIIDNYLKIYPEERHCELIHYGGEFIGCNIRYLKVLFDESKSVMNRSTNVSDLVNFNDEHITSISIYRLWDKIPVNNANAYINRYWTHPNMYLTSTNYHYNPVVLWHLPFEKNKGFLNLYSYMISHCDIPETEKLRKIFGLPDWNRPFTWYGFCSKVKRKIMKL